MAYNINLGVGSPAGVTTFILVGLSANPGGTPPAGGGGLHLGLLGVG